MSRIPPVGDRSANAAKPIYTRILRIDAARQCKVKYHGFTISFSVAPERSYHRALIGGRLQFSVYSNRFELVEMRDGERLIIGQVHKDPFGYLFRGGQQVKDDKGPVRITTGGAGYISADLLFPALLKVKRYNHFNPANLSASIFYGNLEMKLPVDPQALYGVAARERRIFIEANQKIIQFYEERAGKSADFIGSIRIDEKGYLLREGQGVRQGEDWVNINARAKKTRVNVTDFVPRFGIKDVPVGIAPSTGRAMVRYRKISFEFSSDQRNLYYEDLVAGRLYFRVGHPERIMVVRKGDNGESVILGIIPIKRKDGNKEAIRKGGRDVRFDQEKHTRLRIDDLIEELSGREVPVVPSPGVNDMHVVIYNIRFAFPMREGYFFKEDIIQGRMFCRVYKDRILVGVKRDGEFAELGRIKFSKKGVLLKQGEPYLLGGKPVIKKDLRGPRVNIKKLIPVLGVFDKVISSSSISVMRWGIGFNFDIREGDHYYKDLAEESLCIRFWGRRAEIYAMREDGFEYIGSFGLNENNELLRGNGKVLKTKGGPIKAGSRRRISVSKLLPVFKARGEQDQKLWQLLRSNGHGSLLEEINSGVYKCWLKRVCVAAEEYLRKKAPNPPMVSKMLFALKDGARRLKSDREISYELRSALVDEIRDIFVLALEHEGLQTVREGIRGQYFVALEYFNDISEREYRKINREQNYVDSATLNANLTVYPDHLV